jgi:hypothetical protein
MAFNRVQLEEEVMTELGRLKFKGKERTLFEKVKEFALKNAQSAEIIGAECMLFQNGARRGYVNIKYFPFSNRLTQYAFMRNMKSIVITHVLIAPFGGNVLSNTCDDLLGDDELATSFDGIAIESVLSEEYAEHLRSNGWRETADGSMTFYKRRGSNATRS